MILNKKNLFIGIIIGAIGNSLYNLMKKQKKEFTYIKRYNVNSHNNTSNSSKTTTLNKYNITKRFNDLKNQANLIEEKLNSLKK